MSKFTIELRYICETLSGLDESVGFGGIEQAIEGSRNQIFSDYPIFDETYRATLEQKILMHYYTREISEETFGRWKLRLATKMREIMPLYNQYYKSALLDFDPFIDVNLSTSRVVNVVENVTDKVDSTSEGVGVKSGNRNYENKRKDNSVEGSNSESLNLFSDTPQGGVENFGDTNAYLTNMTKDSGSNSSTKAGVGSDDGTESYGDNETTNSKEKRDGIRDSVRSDNDSELIKGKRGSQSYPQLLMELRKSFINTDMMVIDELKDLFFLLYE